MDTVPRDVIECALLDGAPPQLGDGGAWCDAHNKCDHCARDVVDAAREEIRRLKAERDRALAELDKALGEREDAILSERNAAYNKGYDEGFASADDWYAEHAAELAEHGWARLPRDADGKYIRIGDVMETESGKRFEVRFFTLTESEWTVNSEGWFTEKLRHHHAPTVEDVLSEMLDAVDDDRYGQDRIIAEYAAKLRLAGDAE